MKSGVAVLLALIPAAALAQNTSFTSCVLSPGMAQCHTTDMGMHNAPADPPPVSDGSRRQSLGDAEANFGSALGGAIARARERAREHRMENRQLATQALQNGDCATAKTMAARDKDMLAYVTGTCAARDEAAARRQAGDEVAAFAADPRHPSFGQVRGQMADLLRGGQAKTLQDAYDQAVANTPSLKAAPSP
jgi:hypothetical protein